MTRRALSVVVLATLAVVAICSSASSRQPDTVSADLHDRVMRAGSARVIVKIRLPGGAHVPEGQLATAAVSRQRADIASVQGQIMSRLTKAPHRVVHRYRTVPILALEIGTAGLAELSASSMDVESVIEDALSAPAAMPMVPTAPAPDASTGGSDGSGFMVAILDTGVDAMHPLLAGRVAEGACYSSTVKNTSTTVCPNGQEQQTGPGAGVNCLVDLCWHGTHVAGVAAGNGATAGVSFSGVAPGAQIMAVQVFSRFDGQAQCAGASPCILAWDSDLIAGLERVHLLRTVHVFAAASLNVSGGPAASSCDGEPIKLAIDNLRSVGIPTIVSAGNSGATNAMSFPACVSTAVSVSSTTRSDTLSSFSDVSPLTSLLALGENIVSSTPGNSYGAASGTSVSAAQVAGAWAVLRQAVPGATLDQILVTLQSTGLPISDTRSGGSVTRPRISLSLALSSTLGAAPQGGKNLFAQMAAGGSTPSPALSAPAAVTTLALAFNGKLRDRVGQDNTALAADGALDGTLTATLSATGGRTITALRLDSDAPGFWDTASSTEFWVLGVAATLDGALLNDPGTMAVNFPVADGGSFVVFAADFQASEFLPGRTLTLTATFSDGSTATAVTTVAAGPATLALAFNGKLRDRVGQDNTALAADGALDGTLTATLSATGGRTITALRLDSDAPGFWDTASSTEFWLLGVAATLDGALLNDPGTMAVNFPVADGGSFVVFAADFQASEFLPGRTLTLTVTFSDGSSATASTTLVSQFTISVVTSGLSNPTAMAFAPDGRLFVAQQGGELRVVKNGALLPTPFVTVTTDSQGERGLLGVAFDPNFDANQFVYVYYTATSPTIHNRVSRFTASGDVAVPGSEAILLDLDPLSAATNHNGGALHFGLDGKLYIGVGENADGANAQTLENLLGKMLRINPDGSIPSDNPFFTTASGVNRAIWVIGLRNPFTFAIQPGTGRMFINDVGEHTWEEINDGIAGSNYGWPTTEGPTSNPSFRSPLFAYGHGTGPTTGCAIAGGAFYNPGTAQFPGDFVGDYFFADLCSGWIRRFDPASGTAADFISGIPNPVDLQVAADGSLYVLSRGDGAVRAIRPN